MMNRSVYVIVALMLQLGCAAKNDGALAPDRTAQGTGEVQAVTNCLFIKVRQEFRDFDSASVSTLWNPDRSIAEVAVTSGEQVILRYTVKSTDDGALIEIRRDKGSISDSVLSYNEALARSCADSGSRKRVGEEAHALQG